MKRICDVFMMGDRVNSIHMIGHRKALSCRVSAGKSSSRSSYHYFTRYIVSIIVMVHHPGPTKLVETDSVYGRNTMSASLGTCSLKASFMPKSFSRVSKIVTSFPSHNEQALRTLVRMVS